MTKFSRFRKLGALHLMWLLPLSAQQYGITREQADAILSELREIRQLLERQAHAVVPDPQQPERPRARVKLKLDTQNFIGSNDAPLTMVQFTDYQCDFCQRFFLATFPEIKQNYIDKGELKFYTRDLPLDMHPNAFVAAQAAHCAGDQNQFWTMHNRMSADPTKLDMNNLTSYAKDLKLDAEAFRSCVESGKYKSTVQKQATEATTIGANGTPSFVVGRSTTEGVDGELVVGALPYAQFDQTLKDLSGRK